MNRQTSLDLGTASDASETDTRQVETANNPASRLNFPSKLHRILRAPEYSDIICWLPHGRSWRVLQQKRFEKEVLPLFFRHGRYASFARQINGWGFRRIPTGPDFNSYYHELFLRDAPELSLQMTRPSAAELADRKKEEPDSPPNFYLMSKVEPKAEPAANANPQPSAQGPQVMDAPERTAMEDEYMVNLIRRISMYSPQQQNRILQMELSILSTQRQAILERLELLSLRTNSNGPNPFTLITASHRLPIPLPQPTLHYPQLRPQESINLAAAAASSIPGSTSLAQRVALDLYLQSLVPHLQTGRISTTTMDASASNDTRRGGMNDS